MPYNQSSPQAARAENFVGVTHSLALNNLAWYVGHHTA